MNNDPQTHGHFCFNELITSDLTSAKKFYGKLLGWKFTEAKTIYGNTYIVIHKDGDFIGGMMIKKGNVPDDVPLCWDPYVSVDDVDVSAKKVEELGGKVILPPTEIPQFGRFCVVNDPQGISLNLITLENKG